MLKYYTVHGSISCLVEANDPNEANRLMVEALIEITNCEGIKDWDGLMVGKPVETKEEDF